MNGSQTLQIPYSTKHQIALIRKVIKSKVKTVGVRCGTGTAYGWVDILAGGDGSRMFTPEESQILETLGLNAGLSNTALISPENREAFLQRWIQEGLL